MMVIKKDASNQNFQMTSEIVVKKEIDQSTCLENKPSSSKFGTMTVIKKEASNQNFQMTSEIVIKKEIEDVPDENFGEVSLS